MSEDLATWLLEQIAEDERIGQDQGETHTLACTATIGSQWDHACRCGFANRQPAESDAKRRIIGLVDLDFNDEGQPICLGGYGEAYWDAIRILALTYADRPGYREEWRPDTPGT